MLFYSKQLNIFFKDIRNKGCYLKQVCVCLCACGRRTFAQRWELPVRLCTKAGTGTQLKVTVRERERRGELGRCAAAQ